MRPKRDWRSASKTQYKEFCKEYSHIKISYETFKTIIEKWNMAFANHILETGDLLKMPYGVGPLTITKYKNKKGYNVVDGVKYPAKPIDWKASKEYGKIIYHMNYATDGFRYYWAWFPKQSYIKSAHTWKFEMARVHSRLLASYLKNPNDTHKDLYKQWIIRN